MTESLQRFIYSADSIFQIGGVHVRNVSPCQDFAVNSATKTGDKVYLGTSDGCSTGGKTDVGSRFIALRQYAQAKLALASPKPMKRFSGFTNITKADLDFFGLSASDVFATSITCIADQNEACVDVYGDGVVVFLKDDGSMILHKFEWENNAPYYPIYGSELGRTSGLLQQFAQLHASKSGPTPFSHETIVLAGGEKSHEATNHFGFDEGVEGARLVLEADELRATKAIGLFSDGVLQVGRYGELGSHLDWTQVVQECMGFKTFNGDFLKRRIKRAIQNWAKSGLAPQDDFSASVALIELIETQTE